MSATIDVICYKSKVLKNNEHPLMLRVTKDRKRRYLSIGISVKAENWDFEKNKPKTNCPNKDLILNIIEQKSVEYRKQVLEFQSIEKDFSASKLIESVHKPIKKITVENYFNQIIELMIKEKRIGNANSFKFALNSMKTFGGNLDILFSEIDVAWLKKYESWMRNNGNSENTMGVRFRALRAIYNRAIDDNIVKKDYYPFNDFKVSKLKSVTKKRAITKSDMNAIVNLDITAINNYQSNLLELSRDLFVFSYLGCGINLIDIAYLTKENIENNRIVYNRHKTGKPISFSLQPKALELIEKYQTSDNKYLFPIYNNSIHKTELQQHYRIRKFAKKMNKCLQKIGEYLELPINLTTYVARHSFATVLKRSGVNTSIISESLGHSSEKVTQIYLDSFENSQIDEAMKNLL
ncbi:site-specific integrase [Dysgonomonas sp. 520]|uniref:site-specific integrase n=1 Tax=Dysgonomonas sp. 520 TaxID=2302931 RepID=UPI0013D34398|nr:site-specific integrase [Dysgonomonas sp. 520]NDW09335.1 site-specific integrase [Dysgonomonas sp. 520]